MEKRLIPDDKSNWYEGFSGTREDVYIRGRQLMEAKHDEKKDFKSYKMAKDHYKACTDEDKLEEIGVAPVLKYLDEVSK